MMDFLTWIFAGLWHELLSYGTGVAIVVVLLLGAYFSPLGKPYFVIAALVVVLEIVAYSKGISDESKRCQAQQQIVTKEVTGAVTYAKSKKALHARDPYDSPNN